MVKNLKKRFLGLFSRKFIEKKFFLRTFFLGTLKFLKNFNFRTNIGSKTLKIDIISHFSFYSLQTGIYGKYTRQN